MPYGCKALLSNYFTIRLCNSSYLRFICNLVLGIWDFICLHNFPGPKTLRPTNRHQNIIIIQVRATL